MRAGSGRASYGPRVIDDARVPEADIAKWALKRVVDRDAVILQRRRIEQERRRGRVVGPGGGGLEARGALRWPRDGRRGLAAGLARAPRPAPAGLVEPRSPGRD